MSQFLRFSASLFSQTQPEQTIPDAALRTLVCVGVTGQGKSRLCNLILGKNLFHESDSLQSVTSRAEFHDGTSGQFHFRVIDTVGFLDNRMNEDEKERKFGEFADFASDGVDVFLFVMRYERFTEEHVRHFDLFKEQFGINAFERTVLVFTHISRDKLNRHLSGELPQTLKDVLQQVQLAVGVESKDQPGEARSTIEAAVRSCIAKIEGFPKYSNQALEKAKSRREELKERINRLQSSDRKVALTKMICGLNNGTQKYESVMAQLEDAEAAETEEQKQRDNLKYQEENQRREHELNIEKEKSERQIRQQEFEWKNKEKERQHELEVEKEKSERQTKQQEYEREKAERDRKDKETAHEHDLRLEKEKSQRQTKQQESERKEAEQQRQHDIELERERTKRRSDELQYDQQEKRRKMDHEIELERLRSQREKLSNPLSWLFSKLLD